MPAYIIAMVNITNPERYQEYAKRAGPANARHGSRFLVRGGKKHTLEGDIPFERIVVTEFPDVEAAKKFYNSPEYQEARKHRLGACDFHMIVVEGAHNQFGVVVRAPSRNFRANPVPADPSAAGTRG